jgi:hypothetical protein
MGETTRRSRLHVSYPDVARLSGENTTGEHCCLFSQEMGTRRRGGAEIEIQHRDTDGTGVDFARIRGRVKPDHPAQVLNPCPLCLCGSLSLLRVSAAPREPFPGKFELLSRTCPPARKPQLGSSACNPSRYFPGQSCRGGKRARIEFPLSQGPDRLRHSTSRVPRSRPLRRSTACNRGNCLRVDYQHPIIQMQFKTR